MKTASIDNFIEEIERLLRNSNLEEALERYCDYFGVNGQYASQRQIAESNLTRLRSYKISKQSGIEPGEVVLNSIVSASWSVLTELKKASNYHHKEPFYSKVIPRKGKIQHNIPSEMRVNDPEPCKVRVVVSKNVEITASSAYDLPNTTEAPVQILGEEGAVEIRSVAAETFHVQLIPDLPTQHFLPKISTEWTFYITPKTTGTHLLALNLISNIRDGNGALAHQQVVYSIAKEIKVVDQPIVHRSTKMVSEGQGYVWKVPILRYLWMWALVFLSYFWIPVALIGTWGGLMVHKAITEQEGPIGKKEPGGQPNGIEVIIRPDKTLNAPSVTYQDRFFDVLSFGEGDYKIKIPKKWQHKTGILEIFDDQYTCFGTMPPKSNRVDCKCVKTPFTFKIDQDSISIPDEIVQITVDGDSLHPIQGHRKGQNLYEANYYLAKRDVQHTFKITTSTYQCTAYWKPGDKPNIAYFNECTLGGGPPPVMSSVSIRFILDRDVSNYTLMEPDASTIEEYERTERTFGFSYPYNPASSADSIFIVLNGTADGVPCTCVGKESLRTVKNELKVYGKCTVKTCVATIKLEFDVSNPTVTLYRSGQTKNPIWSKNLKAKGREIVLPPLPQGEGKLNVRIVGQDQSTHTAVFTPNKNTISIKASTNNTAMTLKLDAFFRQNLANEQLQIVDAVSRKPMGGIDVNKGAATIYPAKGKTLDVLWKTKGEGGNIATITVAKIAVSNKAGAQQATCAPSSDLVKVVDLRQKTQNKSAKGAGPKVIFPIKN